MCPSEREDGIDRDSIPVDTIFCDVEIDLVGADRQPVAKQLLFLGSVKWLETSAFDSHDLAALQKHRAAITDEPVPLVAVSRNGISCSGLQAVYGPEELLGAWRRA